MFAKKHRVGESKNKLRSMYIKIQYFIAQNQ